MNNLSTGNDTSRFHQEHCWIGCGDRLGGVAIPHVFAAEDNTIRLALIGCGGRGGGAVANAMSAGGLVLGGESNGPATGGPVKLVAMADLRPDQIERRTEGLDRSVWRQD